MSKSRIAERRAVYSLQTAVEPALGASFDLLAAALQDVAKLRQLILSLAIRGKLVPQNVADGSALSMLKRVHEERMELGAHGALKRKAAELVDHGEEWAELPKSWAWSCLANIGVINPRNDVPDDTEASFVQMSSVPVALLEPHKSQRRPWREIKSGFTHFAEGDVGVAKITPCFENGKSTVFRNLDSGVGAGTTELHVVRPLASISPDYILIFLKSPEFLRPGEKSMTGSAGQKRLSRHYFGTHAFPLPPLAEQARIVTRVEELMQLCDALEAHGRLQDEQHARLVTTLFDALATSASANELAENWQRIATHFDLLLDRPEAVGALEQTLLQLAVRGLLVPQDPADEPGNELLARIIAEKDRLVAEGAIKREKPISPVPADEQPFEPRHGWAWAPFGTIVSVSSGITLGSKAAPTVPVTLPYLRVANVQRWHLNLDHLKTITVAEGELPRFLLKPGDLLITEGGDWDKVGRTCIWKGEIELCLHQNHVFKARGVLAEWLPAWAELYLNSAAARTFFANASKQTTNLASINSTQLKGCPFPLPPVAEQHRIVARVKQLRRLCTNLREHLQQARATQSRLADALVAAAAQSPTW